MYLKTLHLRQFRNYLDQRVDFHAPKTILVGNNAQGKSNLLESVELLSTLRSHRASRDRDLVQEGEPAGQITAILERETGPVELGLTLRSSGRRTVMLNGESLRRQLDFLGVLNAVQFSSLDLDLVRGGPGQRRNWLDTLLTQLEPIYAHILQQYNLVLKQRNAFLKAVNANATRNAESGTVVARLLRPSSDSELAIWDAQLATIGSRVIRRRARVLQRLAPIAQTWHQAISGSTENLEIQYAPNVTATAIASGMTPDIAPDIAPNIAPLLEPPEGLPPLNAPQQVESWVQKEPVVVQQAFLEKIKEKAIAEYYQGTTLVGPHRDEVEFTINKTPARQYGSQGQQRTLVLALKLAELKLIEEVVGEAPLLLLDDVLAELDLNRQNQLLDAIQDHFQTLITTTHLGSFDAQWLKSSQILSVEAGQVSTQTAL